MGLELSRNQYQLVSDFMTAVREGDRVTLLNKFRLSSAVQEEIAECLGNYYDAEAKLSVPPFSRGCEVTCGGRPFIDAFYMNDGCIGIECIIFADSQPSEAILHVELTRDQEIPQLTYKYIGS